MNGNTILAELNPQMPQIRHAINDSRISPTSTPTPRPTCSTA